MIHSTQLLPTPPSKTRPMIGIETAPTHSTIENAANDRNRDRPTPALNVGASPSAPPLCTPRCRSRSVASFAKSLLARKGSGDSGTKCAPPRWMFLSRRHSLHPERLPHEQTTTLSPTSSPTAPTHRSTACTAAQKTARVRSAGMILRGRDGSPPPGDRSLQISAGSGQPPARPETPRRESARANNAVGHYQPSPAPARPGEPHPHATRKGPADRPPSDEWNHPE